MNPYEQNPLAEGATGAPDPYGVMWRPPCMPYISAYAIAVKHGFQGSEKEWLHSLGSVFVVKVEDFRQGENDTGTFTYNTTWEEIEYAASQGRIVALDFYGSLAWMSQLGNGFVRFTGAPYYADGQHCYTEFRIMAGGENEFVTYVEKEKPVHWFTVHISAVEDGFATDKNAAEIYDAVSKGQLVRGVEPGGRMMQLSRCDSENAWFTMVSYDGYEDRFSLVAYRVGTDEVSQQYVVIGNGPADGGAQAVWVNFSHNGSGLTADMSSVEIRDAVNLGSIVLGRDPAGRVLQLYRCGETYAWFTGTGYDHETGKFYEVAYLMENGTVSMATWEQTDPEDGGYYTINAWKSDESTMGLSYSPSKEGMASIPDQSIPLPRGARGTGLLSVTTAPTSYTTTVNGVKPSYRISLTTVKNQAGVAEVLAGDTLQYSYYHYPVFYVDSSYAYCKARVSIRGESGENGKDGQDGETGGIGPQGPQGPGAELFKVRFSHASSGYTADKTNAQIYAAMEEGKAVVGIDPSGRMMQCYRCSQTLAWFTALGYDHEDEVFVKQIYRIESDMVISDFGSIPNETQIVQSVIAALPVYGGETQ